MVGYPQVRQFPIMVVKRRYRKSETSPVQFGAQGSECRAENDSRTLRVSHHKAAQVLASEIPAFQPHFDQIIYSGRGAVTTSAASRRTALIRHSAPTFFNTNRSGTRRASVIAPSIVLAPSTVATPA
jgi:hypothetical protein